MVDYHFLVFFSLFTQKATTTNQKNGRYIQSNLDLYFYGKKNKSFTIQLIIQKHFESEKNCVSGLS